MILVLILHYRVTPNARFTRYPTILYSMFMKKKNIPQVKQMADSPLAITSSFYEFKLLKELVERLSDPGTDSGEARQLVSPGLHTLQVSSIEADVSGDLVLSDKKDLVHLSFYTCFYFTCIRMLEGQSHLAWSSSLS
jgi:hypothetical protein